MKKEELFELIGEVDEEKVAAAGMAVTEKKQSRPAWLKWGTAAACLCLAALVWFAAPMLQHKPGTGEVQPGGIPGTETVRPENPSEITQPTERNRLVVNEVDKKMTSDMDVQITHEQDLSASRREAFLKEFEAAIGVRYDDFTAKISDAFVQRSFYSVNVPADASGTEYIPHDYVFEYQTRTGGEVRIAVCSSEAPLRDSFLVCENPKESEISGVSVVIYGYQETFMVEFTHETVNYEIETRNITLEELEELLVGLVG